MFKKKAFMVVFMAMISVAQADVCRQTPGSINCGQGMVNEVEGNGMVHLHGTHVTGSTSVNGIVHAQNVQFASLQVNGSATLLQTVVREETDIKSKLNASATRFESTVDVFSPSVRLVGSELKQNLYMHHSGSKEQRVELDNQSRVDGDIIFDDGNGKVILRGKSKVAGQVIGGVIIAK